MNNLLKRVFSTLMLIMFLVPSVAFAAGSNPPNLPTLLSQSVDNVSDLGVGKVDSTARIYLRASVSAPSADTLFLEAEIQPTSKPLSFVPNATSAAVNFAGGAPVPVSIVVNDLVEDSYHWQVRVRSQAGLFSNWVQFGNNNDTPLPADADFAVNFPPGKPSLVKVVTCQDGCPATHAVKLTWVNPTDKDLKSIEVFRSTDPATAGVAPIATLDSSLEYFVDATVAEGTIYYYRVRAIDMFDTPGQFSDVTSTVTNIEITDDDNNRVSKACSNGGWYDKLGPEENLSLADKDSGCSITYRPNITNPATYEVFVNWASNITPLPEGVSSSQATDANYSITVNGVTQVVSVDQTKRADGSAAKGDNVPSGFFKIGTFNFPVGTSSSVRLIASTKGYVVANQDRFVYLRPLAPSNLIAVDNPNDNGNEIHLSWVASASNNVVGYNVYRASKSGEYDFAKPLGLATGTSFIDASVANDTTYFYVVRATDRLRESVNSVETSGVAKDNLAPGVPKIVSVEAGGGFVDIVWTKIDSAVGYALRYRKTGDAAFTTIFVPGGNATSSKVTGLSDSEYEFGVAARDASGNQSDFAVAKATPQVAAPVPVAQKVVKRVVPEKIAQETPPAPEEGAIKAEQDVRADNERLGVTLAILVIAIAAGIAGYYGYDWYLKRREVDKSKPRSRNGRW